MAKETVNFKVFGKADIDDKATAREYHDMRELMENQTPQATIPMIICRNHGYETYRAFIARITNEMAAANGVKLFTQVNLETLCAMAQNGRLLLNYYDENGNLIIGNKRQRNEVTTDKWKSNLFVSAITGMLMDTPSLYLTKSGVTTADGNQRLTALVKILTSEVKIVGTGTSFDGWKFNELQPDLQEAILSVEVDVMVIHPNLANDTFLNKVFSNMNGKQNKVNKTEEAIATHDTKFRTDLQNMVNMAQSSRTRKSTVCQMLGASHAKNSRMRDIEGILYAYSLICGKNPSSHGEAVEIMLNEYPNTRDGVRKGNVAIDTIHRTFMTMKGIFGPNATTVVERDENGFVYYQNPDIKNPVEYNIHTNTARLRRGTAISSKYFISLFYIAGMLREKAGLDNAGNGFRFHASFNEAMRGVFEKMVVSNDFAKLMNGGPTDISRSKRMLKTMLEEIMSNNVCICVDPTMDAIVRQNWQEELLNGCLAKVRPISWR